MNDYIMVLWIKCISETMREAISLSGVSDIGAEKFSALGKVTLVSPGSRAYDKSLHIGVYLEKWSQGLGAQNRWSKMKKEEKTVQGFSIQLYRASTDWFPPCVDQLKSLRKCISELSSLREKILPSGSCGVPVLNPFPSGLCTHDSIAGGWVSHAMSWGSPWQGPPGTEYDLISTIWLHLPGTGHSTSAWIESVTQGIRKWHGDYLLKQSTWQRPHSRLWACFEISRELIPWAHPTELWFWFSNFS